MIQENEEHEEQQEQPEEVEQVEEIEQAEEAEEIEQAQDFLEQFSRHGNLSQLERDVPAMADNLDPDLDQPLS